MSMAEALGNRVGNTLLQSVEHGPDITVAGGGYPLAVHPQEIDRKYLCAHCALILRVPMQSVCGHRFCKACIEYLISCDSPKVCPQCQRDCDSNPDLGVDCKLHIIKQAYPDNATRRDLNSLQIVCIFDGCKWTGLFKDIEAHFEICGFRPLPCAECGLKLSYSKMLEHLESHQNSKTSKIESLPLFIPQQLASLNTRIQSLALFILRPAAKWPTTFSPLVSRLKNFETSLPSLQNELKHIKELCEGVISSAQSSNVASVSNANARSDESARPKTNPANLSNSQDVSKALRTIDEKLDVYEGVLTVLNREMEKFTVQTERDDAERKAVNEKLQTLERQVRLQERHLAVKDQKIADMEQRMSAVELTSYDGTLIWRITDFKRRREEARSGRTSSIYSASFYTSKTGYKMCAQIYLNGDGTGRGTHVSLFLALQRGLYDVMLQWPFRQKVTLIFIDQNNRQHVLDAFRPDPTSTSFRRPITEMNVASGCPLFLPLSQLDSPTHAYVKDDVAFVKVIVSTDEL